MNHKHFLIYFDFDDTLVYTSELNPYRNREGKTFLISHPNGIETTVCFPGLVQYFNKLKKNDLVKLRILTNSPKELVEVFLLKHGFDLNDVLIFGGQNKPFAKGFEDVLRQTNYPRNKILLIGDSAVDLLTAHTLGINCIQVRWPEDIKALRFKQTNLFNENQIYTNQHPIHPHCFSKVSGTKRIKPKLTVKNLQDLETAVNCFIENKFPQGIPFVDNSKLMLASPHIFSENKSVIIYNISTYYPTGHELFNFSNSNAILRFKDIKKYSKNELNSLVYNRYYYNGKVRFDQPMINFFNFFYDKLVKKIKSLSLSKPIIIIAAPNSLPEYCYKTDVNQMMADNLNSKIDEKDFVYFHRFIYRVFPKTQAHLGGERRLDDHYQTIGVIKDHNFIHRFKTVIIFDDITTTGSQIQAIANYTRVACGFRGDILGLTLGKTNI